MAGIKVCPLLSIGKELEKDNVLLFSNGAILCTEECAWYSQDGMCAIKKIAIALECLSNREYEQ